MDVEELDEKLKEIFKEFAATALEDIPELLQSYLDFFKVILPGLTTLMEANITVQQKKAAQVTAGELYMQAYNLELSLMPEASDETKVRLLIKYADLMGKNAHALEIR